MLMRTALLAILSTSMVAYAGAIAQNTVAPCAKVLAGDGVADDGFGASVDANGNVVVVGADRDDDLGSESGSAYVFDATTRDQLYKLVPEDGMPHALFGCAVAISDEYIIVGACGDSKQANCAGAAYVFDVETGRQLLRLMPDDLAAMSRFGVSVAIDGVYAVVGANGDAGEGAAYVFDASTGRQLTKLLPTGNAAGSGFGCSVGIAGSVIVVGSPAEDTRGDRSGAAYVFELCPEEGGVAPLRRKLCASDGTGREWFGNAVALNDKFTVIGAYGSRSHGYHSGAAYVYESDSGKYLHKLVPDDLSRGDRFGHSVSINGGVVLIGSWMDDDPGIDSGSAYLFDAQSGAQLLKLSPEDSTVEEVIGVSVAIEGRLCVLGARGNSDRGSGAGAVYFCPR